jgi:ankyrin repeat protein
VAVEAGKPACVAALLEAKADPEQSDSAGRSPLLLATELGRKECALAMLSAPHLVGVPYPEVSVDVYQKISIVAALEAAHARVIDISEEVA